MYLEDPAVASQGSKSALIPAFVCAGICVILIRTGFFSFFFLVPLGFCAVAYGSIAAWHSFTLAVLGNGVLVVGIALFQGVLFQGAGLLGAGSDLLYFTLLALGFTWIMANNPPIAGSPVAGPPGEATAAIPRVRTLFRFTAASLVAALAFLSIIYVMNADGGLSALAYVQIEALTSGLIASSGVDAAQQSLLERSLTADKVIELLVAFALRGGALFSAFLLFFFSRQTAIGLARLFRRQREKTSDLLSFHAPKKAIVTLSICLPVILLSRTLSLTIIEIPAWNVLVICVMIFLAQGCGIILFTLATKPIPGFLRLFFIVAFVFLIFSPGINAMVLGALVLLGIAENWIPMRSRRDAVSSDT